VDNRLTGTLATVQASIQNGADIVRVHDIEPVKDVIELIKAIENPSSAD
jgi:dihydropteroate synthase